MCERRVTGRFVPQDQHLRNQHRTVLTLPAIHVVQSALYCLAPSPSEPPREGAPLNQTLAEALKIAGLFSGCKIKLSPFSGAVPLLRYVYIF